MPEIPNAQHNVALYKKSFEEHVALGEFAQGNDFRVVVKHPTGDDFGKIEFLVQGFAIPEQKREDVETRGCHGVELTHYGRPTNKFEITMKLIEPLSGLASKLFRRVVNEKIMCDFTVGLVAESQPSSTEDTTYDLMYCKCGLEQAELDVEDDAPIKRDITVMGHWCSHWDGEAPQTVSWEA